MRRDSRFRPLLGFFIFQYISNLVKASKSKSFRPLLGFFIFQFNTLICTGKRKSRVSVPYWGSLYFNLTDLFYSAYSHRFRPLLGFFIFQCELKEVNELYGMFPSPIGVLYISIIYTIAMQSLVLRFRPLLGFFIFQCIS